jgi:hypothetical protein
MPFNSNSYYRNKWRRQALESLAEARKLKSGPPTEQWLVDLFGYDPRPRDIESAVRSARSTWRLYLSQREICRLDAR